MSHHLYSSTLPNDQWKMYMKKFCLVWPTWFSSVVANYQSPRVLGKEHDWKFDTLYSKWYLVYPLFCLWFTAKGKYKIEAFRLHFFSKRTAGYFNVVVIGIPMCRCGAGSLVLRSKSCKNSLRWHLACYGNEQSVKICTRI